MKKMWFIMSDLRVETFNVYKDGRIGDVTGYSDFIIRFKYNRFKTKKRAILVANKIEKIIKNNGL